MLLHYVFVIACWFGLAIALPPSTNTELAASFPQGGAVFDKHFAKKTIYRAKGKEEHKAQFKEDIALYERYFFGMKNGVIMESGALDGDLYSTSFMFEKHFDWKAIHIEGHVGHYDKLIVNRPHAININAALSNETKTYHYLHRMKPSPVDGILEFMEEKFIKKCHKMYALHRKEGPKAVAKYMQEVQGVKLSSILSELSIKHIDIWVLDVEGAEMMVLDGTDFTKVEIDVILVETNRRGIDAINKNDVMEWFSSRGYTCDVVAGNHACLRRGFVPSKKPNLRLE